MIGRGGPSLTVAPLLHWSGCDRPHGSSWLAIPSGARQLARAGCQHRFPVLTPLHGSPMFLPRGHCTVRWLRVAGLVGVLAAGISAPGAAQSLTAGQLRGTVTDLDGTILSAASVSLEDRQGGVVRFFETDFRGGFLLGLVAPGTYHLLVEQIGYQPVRLRNVVVAAGQVTSVAVRLERRPPPIESVVEVESNASPAGLAGSGLLSAAALGAPGRFHDLADLTRRLSTVEFPEHGQGGLALSASGVPGFWSRLVVDGVEERSIRHPGPVADPVAFPLIARDGVDQGQLVARPIDGEWRGAPGSTLAIQTRRGSGSLRLAPYATFSAASLGGAVADNPADSTASAIQAGAVVSGSLIPDTLSVYLRADFQRLQTPTAFPWERDAAVYQGTAGSLRDLVTAVAVDSFGADVARLVSPTVRTWQGVSGQGRVDWRASGATQLLVRAAVASWQERAPLVGAELPSGAGVELDGRDLSLALGATTVGQQAANEFRLGVSSGRREWGSASPVAETILVHEGAGFGTPTASPATVTLAGVELSDALQYSMQGHQLKVGAQLGIARYQQQWGWASGGRWIFGGLDQFGAGLGDWVQATGIGQVEFSRVDLAVFAQDLWQVGPDLQLLIGARYERQSLPADRLISPLPWVEASGILVDSVPASAGGIAPRLGFVWDSRSRGALVVRGGVAVSYGGVDPSLVAEALTFSGSAQVRRGQGTFQSWPAAPTASAAPWSGTRLTLFSEAHRAPRTFKADAGVSHVLGGGATLSVAAGYHHTDYLLRRLDLNRGHLAGTTQGGRPVYGQLVRQGGLVSPTPGSNRRFGAFDLVSGLVPDGYADYMELTVGLERQVESGLSLQASYTFSRTEDNTPGLLSTDPADQLNPFPDGLAGADWTAGRSDLDVPHRLVVGASWSRGGGTPIRLAATYRLRSGLPFTPGFRPGVDVNGDGSGQNDPVFYGSVSGLSLLRCAGVVGTGFAERNSCRGPMRSTLDLAVTAGLPLGDAARVAVTVEAFNVVATATGILDRAAVLVDPAGVFSVDGAGSVTIPFVANPDFGTLLSRRGDPRMIRVGLRLEY